MRVVIDVLGAPERSGGMRLYAEELVKAWAETEPADELLVIGGPWTAQAFCEYDQVGTTVVAERELARITGQWLKTAALARREKADAVVSVSLIVTPLAGRGRPTLCVVHDWRHVSRPQEFSLLRRAYRSLWRRSVARASWAVQISEKTDRETQSLVPSARRVIVRNGEDHPRRWVAAGPRPDDVRRVLTYGHHANKRPELVIEALSVALERLNEPTTLVVLGAVGDHATELRRLAEQCGVAANVELPGYVTQSEYQCLLQWADLVVLASSDEGFGLPVVEGTYFGVPVVATDDNGLELIHEGLSASVAATPKALGAAIADTLTATERSAPAGRAPRSWGDAAVEIRNLVAAAASGSPQKVLEDDA